MSSVPVLAVGAVFLWGVDSERGACILRANMLNDVNLATSRPSARLAHHPESRPCTHTTWELDTCFHLAIEEGLFAFGEEACRSIFAVFVGLFACFDLEATIFDAHVLRALGVVLQLVVAPTTSTEVIAPNGLIEGSAIELIGPHERIVAPLVLYSHEGCNRFHRSGKGDGNVAWFERSDDALLIHLHDVFCRGSPC